MHQDITTKIKTLRKQRNLTTQDMAERLNIDISAYTRLESGKTFTWAKYLDELLGAFEMSAEDFFSDLSSNVNISNKNNSFGGYQMTIDNIHTFSKEYVEKIEYLYQERLKDKDAMIAQLQKIIEQMSNS
jgi:transcriptional regulator with XRE-family HTH domain